jgi:anti-sigma factor ChrR (cupin superfamily)
VLLDPSRLPFRATRHPGVGIVFLHSEESGRATVLIRMAPGASYPGHRHTGPEELFILQGGYRDHLGDHVAGEYVRYEAGTAHRPVALPGVACIFFAIAHEGIEPLDHDDAAPSN